MSNPYGTFGGPVFGAALQGLNEAEGALVSALSIEGSAKTNHSTAENTLNTAEERATMMRAQAQTDFDRAAEAKETAAMEVAAARVERRNAIQAVISAGQAWLEANPAPDKEVDPPAA